jgi:hypothetical protein
MAPQARGLALYYALHFLMVRAINVWSLQRRPARSSILGCGTGVAGAAIARL